MRTAASLLLALAGGCYYDRPNPWNTASDEAAYEEKVHEDWLLDVQTAYRHPQEPRPGLLDADLEGWRDTVLARADGPSLSQMRRTTLRRIAVLEKDRSRLLALDPIQAETALTRNGLMLRTERTRLKLLDARGDSESE